MAVRKTPRAAGTTAHRSRSARKRGRDPLSRQFSAIVGAALIGIAVLWFVWLLARQLNPGMVSLTLPLLNMQHQQSSRAPADPLIAAGITLSTPPQGQQPLLTKQQALLLVAQMEPQIAAKAGGVDARYTLFSYQGGAAGAIGFHNTPVWLVHYSSVAEPRPDTAADPQAASASHDFYVFLDANSGRELLAIWL